MSSRSVLARGTAVVAAALLLFPSPVASRKPPPEADYLDETFSSSLVDRIVVLRVADVRLDKSIEMKQPDEIAQRTVRRMFRRSPYTIAYESPSRDGFDVSQDDLDLLDATWVGELGEPDDRWVLLIALQDVTKKKTFGSAYGALCTGYLFDKEVARPVWQHETVGSMGHGGLTGLALKGAARGQAFQECVTNLLLTFPERR